MVVDHPACVSCGAQLAGPYCAACGERVVTEDDARFSTFVRDAASDAVNADSRLWRSFRALIGRPGLLTAEYLRGRRKPYLSPFQVFLIANVVLFAALSLGFGFNTFTTQLRYHIGQPGYGEVAEHLIRSYGAQGSPAYDRYAARFDETTPRFANSLVILMVPMLAFVLWLMYGRRRKFLTHVVMSLHLFAFIMLLMVAVPAVALLLVGVVPGVVALLNSEGAMLVLLGTAMTTYFAISLRRAFGDRTFAAVLRGAATFLAFYPILTVYRMILFFAVYVSLR